MSTFAIATLLLTVCAEYTTSPEVHDPIEPSLVQDGMWKKKGWGGNGGGYSIGGGASGGAAGGGAAGFSFVTTFSTEQETATTEYFTLPGFTTTVSYVPEPVTTTLNRVETSLITISAGGDGAGTGSEATSAGDANARTTTFVTTLSTTVM